MPVRIYSLAKELDLDSKVLVDLCLKAGVTGKGSALASLTDDEAAKVKTFVSGGSRPAGRPAAGESAKAGGVAVAEPPVLRREDYVPPAGVAPGKPPFLAPRVDRDKPIPEIVAKKPAPEPAAPPNDGPPAGGEIVAPEIAAEAQSAAAPFSAPPSAPAARPEPPARAPGPVLTGRPPVAPEAPRRPTELESPRKPPIVIPRKPPVVEGPRKAGEPTARRPGGETGKPRGGPAIRVAPLPSAQQPKPPTKNEPAPQKPDIRLSPDVIRAGKSGATPLKEHIRKNEIKRKAEAAKGAKPGAPARPQQPLEPLGLLPGGGRDRGRRGGKVAATPADDRAGIAGRETRPVNRKRSSGNRRGGDDEQGGRRARLRMKRTGANTAAPRKGGLVVQLPCTIRGFSEAVGLTAAKVLAKMMSLGKLANINSELSAEMADLLAVELGLEIEIRHPLDLERQMLAAIESDEQDPSLLEPRPPVVTFLGHVDHGKTSLLDKIIGIDVVSGESGGITQHIRAYRIEKAGRPIAFVDTPGHEAFTEMRARGANVTDVAVLVVAGDDGVMPQTEEAISHARAANVPIVVALNKMDLHGVNTQRIYEQLAANNLLPTEWGGDTEVVKTSALTGMGIDQLLETLLTLADLHEWKANPRGNARGACLEAEVHEGRGVVAKLLVQSGTLKVGDIVVCGPTYGRVKAMYDTLEPRKQWTEAPPSTPVNMTGFESAPGAGDHFYVLDDIGAAREIAEKRSLQSRHTTLFGQISHVTLENLHERLGGGEPQTLNIVLRADVRGSIEAILKEFRKLDHPEVQIKILQATVGGISEADVHLADASDAVIIGFNVVPDEGARSLAEQRGVQIRRYEIIYQVTDDLRAALEGMLKPEERELELGRALVQQVFAISRVGVIAGCRVLMGTIERNCRVRVIRDNRIIGEYGLESLRREKDDVREVREGFECGMKLAGYNDLKQGDVLEAYRVESVARKLT